MDSLKLAGKTRSRSRTRSSPRSAPRTTPRTADAERRLRAFVRGFGIEDEAATAELLRRLERLAPPGIGPSPEEAAGRWFAAVLALPAADAAKALAAGRLAWLAAGAARRWPLALFGDMPPVLIEALRRAAPALPPAILHDAMPAAPLAAPRLGAIVPSAARLRARTA